MGTWAQILPRKHHYNSKLCTLEYIELFSVSQRVRFSPLVRMWMVPSALVCDGESWWRSTMPWPAVSSVYEECHHSWQPSRSMIYTLPIATGTCREVTTGPRRIVELFRARGVLDASRRNDTVWCLKFNHWNTVQTFAGDAFQTCLSSDKEAVHCSHFLLQLQWHHSWKHLLLRDSKLNICNSSDGPWHSYDGVNIWLQS